MSSVRTLVLTMEQGDFRQGPVDTKARGVGVLVTVGPLVVPGMVGQSFVGLLVYLFLK